MLVWQQQATGATCFHINQEIASPQYFQLKNLQWCVRKFPASRKIDQIFQVTLSMSHSKIFQSSDKDSIVFCMRRISNPIQWRRKMELVLERQTDIFLVDLHKIIKIWQQKSVCFFNWGIEHTNKTSFDVWVQSVICNHSTDAYFADTLMTKLTLPISSYNGIVD